MKVNKKLLFLSLLNLLVNLPIFSQQESIGRILEQNGTIIKGSKGSFDARDYKLTLGKNNEPIFKANNFNQQKSTYTWSSLGNGYNGTDDRVLAAAIDGNGHLYIGGWFTEIEGTPANHIAMWDGSKWLALPSGSSNGVNDIVNTIAISGNDVYVGGSFTALGDGTSANYIAKWDGNSWSTLPSGSSNGVKAVSGSGVVQVITVNGGNVYLGGQFQQLGDGTSAKNIAEWDGATWHTFPIGSSNGVNALVFAIAFHNNDMYVGGGFTQFGDGSFVNRVAKWDGNTWSTLPIGSSNGINGTVSTIAVKDSEVYMGGFFSKLGDGTPANNIVKWNGSKWDTLPTPDGSNGVNSGVNSIIFAGNYMYIGGFFTKIGIINQGAINFWANFIARWDGNNWSKLGSDLYHTTDGVNSSVDAIAINGNDLYAVGKFTKLGNGSIANRIAKWDGNNWSVFRSGSSNGFNNVVNSIVVSGNKVLAAGNFNQLEDGTSADNIAEWEGGSWKILLRRYNNGLEIDNGLGGATELTSKGDSIFVGVGGDLSSYGAVYVWDGIDSQYGSDWPSLGNGFNGAVKSVALSGGIVYAGGDFTQIGQQSSGNAAYYIAKWDGNIWTPLSDANQTYSNGVNGSVYAIAHNGNDLYIGGAFTRLQDTQGTYAYHISKWDGSKWSVLGNETSNGVIGNVNKILVNGNDVYVAGAFTQLGDGTSANHIAKWDGNNWSILPSGNSNGVNGNIKAMVFSGGKLYVGGDFTRLGDGTIANHLAMWDGTKWSPLDNGVSGSVNCMAVSPTEGKIYFGGDFQTINGNITANYIGSFNDPANPTDVENSNSTTPKDFILYQNYPNPFNPSTVIRYSIPKLSNVKITVYNMLGQAVQNLFEGEKASGNYEVSFDASGLSSGVYFYRIEAGSFSETKKMLLMK